MSNMIKTALALQGTISKLKDEKKRNSLGKKGANSKSPGKAKETKEEIQ